MVNTATYDDGVVAVDVHRLNFTKVSSQTGAELKPPRCLLPQVDVGGVFVGTGEEQSVGTDDSLDDSITLFGDYLDAIE